MQEIKVTIALDPVNDGAEITEIKIKRKDEGALIIGTNGETRIADACEAQRILDMLSEVGHGEYLGNTDYIAIFNGNRIINFGTGKCFVGSALIMKYSDGGLSLLVGDEFKEAAAEFESRLITLVGDGQEFSALEIL